jgi:hypothetical protein
MRTRGVSEKKYHIDKNLWVRGFRSMCDDYDETVKHYEFDKFRENPRYLEIVIELRCSYTGNYNMIPIDIIGSFKGFEEDDMPDEPGWFLGILAKSAFVEETSEHSRNYFGPDKDWFLDAMLWWDKNEPYKFGDLCHLANNYVNLAVTERNLKLMKLCKYSANHTTLNENITSYILTKYTVNGLIDFVNRMDARDLYLLYYLMDTSNFENYLEDSKLMLDSKAACLLDERRLYYNMRHTEIAEIIDTEMCKHL